MASAKKRTRTGGSESRRKNPARTAAAGVSAGDRDSRIGELERMVAALEGHLRDRTAQLQAAHQELEAFSYSVSHDLRAPLRTIDAFSQLVADDHSGQLDAQGRQYLDIVRQSSRKLGGLIDALLHLSRAARGEMRRRPVDLSGLAQAIIAGLRQAEPQRTVEATIAPGLVGNGDERLMRIALDHLLNNAWKFTGRQPQARLEFAAESQAGEKVLLVRDNGAGFDMKYANKLFGVFQRLHSHHDFPGHGIGLATVQRIIHRHGGRTWAQAAVNQGATFYFTLPEG